MVGCSRRLAAAAALLAFLLPVCISGLTACRPRGFRLAEQGTTLARRHLLLLKRPAPSSSSLEVHNGDSDDGYYYDDARSYPTICCCSGRREWMWKSLMKGAGLAVVTPSHAHAAAAAEPQATRTAASRPFAPPEALIPATRVKLWLEQCLTLAQQAAAADSTPPLAKLQELERRLVREPPDFLAAATSTTAEATSTNQQPKPGKAYMDSYQKGLDQLNLLQRPGAWLVQSGEIAAWQRLQRQERSREGSSALRAAFNAYTNQLVFRSDAYQLNVPPPQRSQLIRNDALPDVKSVIAADMDLRYLYRNKVLTNVEDARAELAYLRNESSQDDGSVALDLTELVRLLTEAQGACQAWFDFIDETDVQEAIRTVQMTAQ